MIIGLLVLVSAAAVAAVFWTRRDAPQPQARSTECEFECAKIAGRKFVDVQDHASYLCAGGCAKIIEALAQS